jgi:predicted ester cyclase
MKDARASADAANRLDAAISLGHYLASKEKMTMSASPAESRLDLVSEVQAILESETPRGELLRNFLRFASALTAKDLSAIDDVVTPDSRFHDLEVVGYPRGPEGIKKFRREVNAAFPDQRATITAVRFEGDDIIEVDLDSTATHKGEFMNVPASGRRVRFMIHTRERFVGGKLAERWDRVDIEYIMRQLTGPAR